MANKPVVNIDPDGMWVPSVGAIVNFLASITWQTHTTTYIYTPPTSASFMMGTNSTTTQTNSHSLLGDIGSIASMLFTTTSVVEDGKRITNAAGVMGKNLSDQFNTPIQTLPPQSKLEFSYDHNATEYKDNYKTIKNSAEENIPSNDPDSKRMLLQELIDEIPNTLGAPELEVIPSDARLSSGIASEKAKGTQFIVDTKVSDRDSKVRHRYFWAPAGTPKYPSGSSTTDSYWIVPEYYDPVWNHDQNPNWLFDYGTGIKIKK